MHFHALVWKQKHQLVKERKNPWYTNSNNNNQSTTTLAIFLHCWLHYRQSKSNKQMFNAILYRIHRKPFSNNNFLNSSYNNFDRRVLSQSFFWLNWIAFENDLRIPLFTNENQIYHTIHRSHYFFLFDEEISDRVNKCT